MQFHHFLGKREAKTRLAFRPCMKALEQVREVFLGNARAVIAHDNHSAATLDDAFNLYGTCRIAHGVRKQVKKHSAQLLFIARNNNRLVRKARVKRKVSPLRLSLQRRHAVVEKLPQVERITTQGEMLAVDFRKRQHFPHQIGHAVAFLHNHCGGNARINHIGADSLGVSLDRHERGFELVRRVLEEPLHARLGIFYPATQPHSGERGSRARN